MSFRQIKGHIANLLLKEDVARGLEAVCAFGLKKAVSPLISLFNDTNELRRWRAVTGLGEVVQQLARQDMESARVVMRRLMWSLNDESGGIGWGSPEAMAEICSREANLAREYSKILVSYINPAGNHLEHPLLQRGLLWGLARLARARPELIQAATPYFEPFVRSNDPNHRGLTAWALAGLNTQAAESLVRPLKADQAVFTLYQGYWLTECRISLIAKSTVNRGK